MEEWQRLWKGFEKPYAAIILRNFDGRFLVHSYSESGKKGTAKSQRVCLKFPGTTSLGDAEKPEEIIARALREKTGLGFNAVLHFVHLNTFVDRGGVTQAQFFFSDDISREDIIGQMRREVLSIPKGEGSEKIETLGLPIWCPREMLAVNNGPLVYTHQRVFARYLKK